MPDNYTFAAVASPGDVTHLLKDKRARKARVAAVGQENQHKRFNVLDVPSHDHKDWPFKEGPFYLNSDDDTKAVTKELNKSDLAAVTFFGQEKKYYVWWLDD